MALKINEITFDSRDPAAIARFWIAAASWFEDPSDPIVDGSDDAVVVSPDGTQTLLFERVPEQKSVKNRVHLDLAPTDATRDHEVERLIGIGATMYDDQRRADGGGWVVMRDPEGNEFCIVRSDAERDG